MPAAAATTNRAAIVVEVNGVIHTGEGHVLRPTRSAASTRWQRGASTHSCACSAPTAARCARSTSVRRRSAAPPTAPASPATRPVLGLLPRPGGCDAVHLLDRGRGPHAGTRRRRRGVDMEHGFAAVAIHFLRRRVGERSAADHEASGDGTAHDAPDGAADGRPAAQRSRRHRRRRCSGRRASPTTTTADRKGGSSTTTKHGTGAESTVPRRAPTACDERRRAQDRDGTRRRVGAAVAHRSASSRSVSCSRFWSPPSCSPAAGVRLRRPPVTRAAEATLRGSGRASGTVPCRPRLRSSCRRNQAGRTPPAGGPGR